VEEWRKRALRWGWLREWFEERVRLEKKKKKKKEDRLKLP